MKINFRIIHSWLLLLVFLLPAWVLTRNGSSESFSKTNLLQFTHSHNDYEHHRPLLDALENHFYSVEADIWLVNGEILVAHDQGKYKGSLKELYLDPLQRLVKEKGSIYGDQQPIDLWIDIKDENPELLAVLDNLLKNYPMLTVFTESQIIPGMVTAILTGYDKSKIQYGKQFAERRACRDSNYFFADDPPAGHTWLWYALNWSSNFTWKGQGEMPEAEYQKLVTLVNRIHALGRKVRFYATPDRDSYWRIALKAKVDLINTDFLPELRKFLELFNPGN